MSVTHCVLVFAPVGPAEFMDAVGRLVGDVVPAGEGDGFELGRVVMARGRRATVWVNIYDDENGLPLAQARYQVVAAEGDALAVFERLRSAGWPLLLLRDGVEMARAGSLPELPDWAAAGEDR